MLESLFYSLGIITMTIFLTLMFAVILMLLRVRQNIMRFKSSFTVRAMGLLKEHNIEVASALGLTVANIVIDRVRTTIAKKRASS